MKIVCGIISYLPDDEKIRATRMQRLNTLLLQVDAYLNIPIVIVAQNWRGISLRKDVLRNQLTIYNYNERLGINRARQVLREKFLESDYDYIIHLDDDCTLTKSVGVNYIQALTEHPGMWCFPRYHLLKLAAISRDVYEKIEIPDGGADDPNCWKRFYEDMYMHETLRKLYSDLELKIKIDLSEHSNSAFDESSTGWHNYTEKWTRRQTGNNTRYLIKYVTKASAANSKLLKWRNHLDSRELKDLNIMLWKPGGMDEVK